MTELDDVQLEQASMSSADATERAESVEDANTGMEECDTPMFAEKPVHMAEKLEIQFELFKHQILGLHPLARKNIGFNFKSSSDASAASSSRSDLNGAISTLDTVVLDAEQSVKEMEGFCTVLHRQLLKRSKYLTELSDLDNQMFLLLSEQGLKEDYGHGYTDLGSVMQNSSQLLRDIMLPPLNRAIGLLQTLLNNAIPDLKLSLKKYYTAQIESDVFGGRVLEMSEKVIQLQNAPPAPVADPAEDGNAAQEKKVWKWLLKVVPEQRAKTSQEVVDGMNEELMNLRAHEAAAKRRMDQWRQEILDKTSLISLKIKHDLASKLSDISRVLQNSNNV